MLHTNK
jgi:hypothetical protein